MTNIWGCAELQNAATAQKDALKGDAGIKAAAASQGRLSEATAVDFIGNGRLIRNAATAPVSSTTVPREAVIGDVKALSMAEQAVHLATAKKAASAFALT